MVDLDTGRIAVMILDLQNEVIHDDGAFGSSGAAAHAEQRNVPQIGKVASIDDLALSGGAS